MRDPSAVVAILYFTCGHVKNKGTCPGGLSDLLKKTKTERVNVDRVKKL